MAIYYLVAAGVSKWIYHQPKPEPETLAKYIVSRIADFIEFDFVNFDLPVELEPIIRETYPDFPRTLNICLYHKVLDLDNALYKTTFYKHFPWYLLAMTVCCVCLKWYKAATMLPEGEAKREDIPLRGILHVDPKTFCKRIRKKVDDPAAAVETDGGALLFSGNRLREHMSIFGASGSGKSQFLLAFLASFFANRNAETRVIIVDRKGEFYAHFGREGDTLFHPFDERSVKWTLFNELDIPKDFLVMPPDIKTVSKFLYPLTSSKESFWPDAAGRAFCAAAAYCVKNGTATNKELVKLCNAPLSDLVRAFKTLPEGMPEKNVFEDSPKDTTGSILAHLKNGTNALEVCQDGDFSIRDWIHNGTGNLFLSSAGKNDTAFMPILSLFIELIGREINDLTDSGEGGVKYLFVIDELAAYPKMAKLHYLVAEARSKGVAVIVATQTIQKVLNVYGDKDGKDILGNKKSKVIFRTIEAQDAEYLSRTIGTTEKERTAHAKNKNASTVLGRVDGRVGETITKQIVNDPAFLPSELTTLDPGNAVVLHPDAGEYVAKLKFEMFRGKKRGIEYEPIREKIVSAREYAEIEKERAAAEEAKKKAEQEEKMKALDDWRKKLKKQEGGGEAAAEEDGRYDNYLL